MRENGFLKTVGASKPILELIDRKFTHGTICEVGIRILAILRVEKVVFWTLSKLFWSCS